MEICIPTNYTTYTSAGSFSGGITVGLDIPENLYPKLGFVSDWALSATTTDTTTLTCNFMDSRVATLECGKIDDSAVGEDVYFEFSSMCHSGKIQKQSATSYYVNLTKIGDVDYGSDDETPVEEEAPVEEETPEEDETPTEDDNAGPDKETDDVGESENTDSDVEYCIDELTNKPHHLEFNLSTATPSTETNDDNKTEYVYIDKKDGKNVVEIRQTSELGFIMWYNKNETSSYLDETTIPAGRINHTVLFEKHLGDTEPSNFEARTVFTMTKSNYGDDEILIQMDATLASKFNVDLGCYILDYDGNLDDYNLNTFLKDVVVANGGNISVLRPFNKPTPTPTPTKTPTPTNTPTKTPTKTPTPTDTIGTYVEVPLKQSESGLKFYMGWYGVCGYNCRPFDLKESSVRDMLFRVFQINEQNDNYSIFNTSFSQVHDEFYQDFTELECGHPYLIVLKKGNGTLDIPGFVEARKASEDVGRLTRKCTADYDADPGDGDGGVVQDCCDGISESSSASPRDGFDTFEFALKNGVSGTTTMDGKLCWNTFTGDGTQASTYSCPFESEDENDDWKNGGLVISVGYTLDDTNNKFIFSDKNGVCYEAKLTSKTGLNVFKKI